MTGAWWTERTASDRATLAARLISHAALGLLLLRLVSTSPALVTAGSIGLGVSTISVLVAFIIAAHRATDVCKPLYSGVALATLGGVLSQLHNVVAHVIPGRTPSLPNPSLWLLVLGVNPVLAATFALVIGRRRRQALSLAELLDVVLVATAAAVVALMLAQLSPGDPTSGTGSAETLMLIWRSGMIAAIALAALLLATRGDAIGTRPAAMLVIGTALLEVAHAVVARQAVAIGHVDATGGDLWWGVAVSVMSLALPARIVSRRMYTAIFPAFAEPRAGVNEPSDVTAIDGLRARAVIAAIVINAGAAFVLGVTGERNLLLAGGVVIFGCTLATRAGMVFDAERKARQVLAVNVIAERELSATLERAVDSRTAELAEAQRVLQRMWTLGQQISLELNPARVLDRFIEAVVDIVSADGGALGLMTDAGPLGLLAGDGRVRIAAAIGISAPLAGREVPVGESALGRAIRAGKPWTAADAAAESGLLYEPPGTSLLVRGILIVPIHRRRERIGAVAVTSRTVRTFTPAEIERVEAMTDLLTMTLSNAELVESLRQAEWRFRTLFRAAPDVVLTVLQSGRVREANDAVREVAGIDPVHVVGRMLADMVMPDDRLAVTDALSRAIGGTATRCEVRIPRENAPPRVVAFAASRLPEADPPSALVIGRDVTSERDLRARLVETERLAAVGELVAGVAHEVNNPLSSISAFAQLLLRDPTLPEVHRDSIEVIRSETARASQVVKDLLAFARRSDHRREALDLDTLVERTLRLRGFQLTDANVAVDLDLDGALPPVVADARQLQQVVLNLVTNAVQAMAPLGGGTLRIATRALQGSVVLEIGDTGPGIAPAARPHVFEPFFTTKGEGEGTGLGLSVSYGIITAHGGSIGVADTSDHGTTMVVSLPTAATGLPGTGAAGEVPVAAVRSPLAGLRVLVVDDEEMLRTVLDRFAALRGFSIVPAGSGEEALTVLEKTSVDAIVCDLRMPGMDGSALHEVLRRDRPGLAARTVFMTGDVTGRAVRGGAIGRQPVLMKPFSLDRLEEVLVALVRGQPVPQV